MIGRIRNNLFWTIAVLFLAKFIAVVCTLDDALGIRDSWSEEIDGHRRYPEEYAGSLHWRASVGRFRRRVLLLRSVSICTQKYQPKAWLLYLGWDLTLVPACMIMHVLLQHDARDFIHDEGVWLADAVVWLLILIFIFRALWAAPLGFKEIMKTPMHELEFKLQAKGIEV
ncbi:hypothetical protein A1Q2_06599 [Trichosporon asahii var. asahii CBS 8904]|uniref:Uncharacterized protein n=2 Tax=Trichosporon asahii var. asahii TaxID=189963 RepID=K1WBJ0_TRIAC|nr:hypothetical protein A1Q1_02517 [Trichosporon asahii var. asahii CBS 2479]EJT48496.1 hypothetical protein A1Q1_02517 [Trichosporon asahii var. asahii CBS 2479]EKC99058.1 hypothetical protein A1Q2_06599 [Trichosporon asahii var. asahii CBS 8904]